MLLPLEKLEEIKSAPRISRKNFMALINGKLLNHITGYKPNDIGRAVIDKGGFHRTRPNGTSYHSWKTGDYIYEIKEGYCILNEKYEYFMIYQIITEESR